MPNLSMKSQYVKQMFLQNPILNKTSTPPIVKYIDFGNLANNNLNGNNKSLKRFVNGTIRQHMLVGNPQSGTCSGAAGMPSCCNGFALNNGQPTNFCCQQTSTWLGITTYTANCEAFGVLCNGVTCDSPTNCGDGTGMCWYST
jgi:hypothetical protein